MDRRESENRHERMSTTSDGGLEGNCCLHVVYNDGKFLEDTPAKSCVLY